MTPLLTLPALTLGTTVLMANTLAADNSLVIVAVAAFCGQTVAVVVSAWLVQRNAAKAQRAASDAATLAVKVVAEAKIATAKAQEDAAEAQKQAADAAKELVKAAQATDSRLDSLKTTTDKTHRLVNGSRTALLTLVADLRGQISRQNPDDKAAEAAAADALQAAQQAAADLQQSNA